MRQADRVLNNVFRGWAAEVEDNSKTMDTNQTNIIPEAEDDGSLAFLRIPRDENSRSLQGEEVKQSRIVNTSFWVSDFLEDVPTRFSKAKGTTVRHSSKSVPKEILRELLSDIKTWLETELHLTLKADYQIFPIAENRYDKSGRALDYVGYKFYREQKLMRKTIKKNLCRHVARQNKRKQPLSPKDYKQGICSWLGWAKHSNSKHLLKTVIKKEYYASIL